MNSSAMMLSTENYEISDTIRSSINPTNPSSAQAIIDWLSSSVFDKDQFTGLVSRLDKAQRVEIGVKHMAYPLDGSSLR